MKLNLDAAYRKIHVLIKMALLGITSVEEIAYILLRLPFGVANSSNYYSLISDPIFDMTNDILQNVYYNPDKLYSPLRSEFDGPKQLFDEGTPFGVARPLFVDVSFRFVKTDGYVDNVITVALDVSRWVKRAKNVAPLIVHSLFRSIDESALLPWNDPVSRRKLKEEGTPSEEKIVLGWRMNSKTFRVYLLIEKYKTWDVSLSRMLIVKKTKD